MSGNFKILDVYSDALRRYKENFFPPTAVFLVLAGTLVSLNIYLITNFGVFNPVLGDIVLPIYLQIPFSILNNVLGAFALVGAVSLFSGKFSGINGFFRGGAKYFWRVILAQILMLLILVLAGIAVLAVSILPLFFFAPLGILIFVTLAIILVLFISTRFSIYVPAIIVEGLGPIDGLKRSWRLTGQSPWKVLGTLLTLIAILFAFALLLVAAISVVSFLVTFSLQTILLVIVVMLIVGLISIFLSLYCQSWLVALHAQLATEDKPAKKSKSKSIGKQPAP